MSTLAKRKPAVELTSVKDMSREDWLDWRRKGIGGSDVAAIMGCSPWGTARDLYYKKKGIKGSLEDEADSSNWVAKEVGHLLEPLVAKIFAVKTGFKPYEIQKMFAHPDYPFMLANVDFFFEFEEDITMPDGTVFPAGTRAILECKTSILHNKEKWEGGAIPVNYEYQGRHYMSVMDVDVVFFACLFSNNENDFVWSYVTRDMGIEEDMIAAQVDFWQNHVEAGVEPPYTEGADLVLQSIRNHFGHPDKDAGEVELTLAFADTLVEYEHLRDKKSKAKKAVDSIDEEMKKIQATIIEEMETSAKATCKGDDGIEFIITNNPILRDDVDKDGLKAQYPQVFEKFVVKKPSSPRFTVKRAKKKAS